MRGEGDRVVAPRPDFQVYALRSGYYRQADWSQVEAGDRALSSALSPQKWHHNLGLGSLVLRVPTGPPWPASLMYRHRAQSAVP